MGLFSFLTGSKKADDHEADREANREAANVASAPSVTTSAGVGPGATEEMRTGTSGTPQPRSDTPFKPPDAWNTDALTAPIPENVGGEKPDIGPVDPAVTAELQPQVVEQLKTVFDPEIPVDIYELGLVYDIIADADRKVLVKMTLTSPACPSAQQIPSEARYKIKALPTVKNAWVEIVWEPPWDKDRMSEAAKLQLGFF